MSYFNTNKERGATLAKSRKKAAKQDDVILSLFKVNPKDNWTPWEVYKFIEDFPLTSCRRSISTMAAPKTQKNPKGGQLIETGSFRNGGFGKPNRVYKYNPKAK